MQFFFLFYLKFDEHIVTDAEFNTTTDAISEPTYLSMNETSISTENVMYPSYMSNFGVLILIAIAVIAQLTHLTKIILMWFITILHCIFNISIMTDLYIYEDKLAGNP